MSTDHNRIKVADLEINEPNKILTTNTDGELEFSDINNIKIDSYNALDYSIAGKALDARQGKVLAEVLTNHLTDLNAHPQLLVKARIIPVGQMLVFKVAPNENENEKEVGDFCMGIVENQKIEAIYNGGDTSLLTSFDIINYIQLNIPANTVIC